MPNFESQEVRVDDKSSIERAANEAWLRMSPVARFEFLKTLVPTGFTEDQLREFSAVEDFDDINDGASNGEVVGRLMAAYNATTKTLDATAYHNMRDNLAT